MKIHLYSDLKKTNKLFEFRENMWWTCYRIRTSTCTAILHTNSTPDPDSAVTMLTSKTSSLQYLNKLPEKWKEMQKCPKLSFISWDEMTNIKDYVGCPCPLFLGSIDGTFGGLVWAFFLRYHCWFLRTKRARYFLDFQGTFKYCLKI